MDARPTAVVQSLLGGDDILTAIDWTEIQVYVAVDYATETIVATGLTYAQCVLAAEACDYRTVNYDEVFHQTRDPQTGSLTWAFRPEYAHWDHRD